MLIALRFDRKVRRITITVKFRGPQDKTKPSDANDLQNACRVLADGTSPSA